MLTGLPRAFDQNQLCLRDDVFVHVLSNRWYVRVTIQEQLPYQTNQ